MTENPENWDEALSAEHLEPRTTALDCIGDVLEDLRSWLGVGWVYGPKHWLLSCLRVLEQRVAHLSR